MEYSTQVKALGATPFESLSKAVRLEPDYLANIDCLKGHAIIGHYYPACPEPDRAIGSTKHPDPSFLTILLQDHIGELQVYYQDQWIDVPPVPGALVVNIGDMLQTKRVYGPIKELVSEDKPAAYRENSTGEFLSRRYSKGHDGFSALDPVRLFGHWHTGAELLRVAEIVTPGGVRNWSNEYGNGIISITGMKPWKLH